MIPVPRCLVIAVRLKCCVLPVAARYVIPQAAASVITVGLGGCCRKRLRFCRAVHDLCMDSAWILYVFAWVVHGFCMDSGCILHGCCAKCAWTLHGFCKDFELSLYGLCLIII